MRYVLLCLLAGQTLIGWAQTVGPTVDPYLLRLRKTVYSANNPYARVSERSSAQRATLRQSLVDMGVSIMEEDPTVQTIVECACDSVSLALPGVDVHSLWGDFFVAHFPVSLLDTLAQVPGIQGLELAKPVDTDLNISRLYVNMDQVETAYPNIKGNDVIIGLIDSGIDITHPTFQKPNGDTRILNIWDQTVEGTPPTGFISGTEWSATQINNGTCTHLDEVGHGTLVAGIAAGNGRSNFGSGQSPYIGIAPEADIIMVKFRQSNPLFVRDGKSIQVLDGMKYIAERAQALGKPFVINLSLGSKYGPRDGTSLFERSVSAFVDDATLGKGRIVVKSAGNDGANNNELDNAIHAEGNGNKTVEFRVNILEANQRNGLDLDIYYDENANYSISLESPGGTVYGPIPFGQSGIWNFGSPGFDPDEGLIFIDNYTQPQDADIFYYGAANPLAQISISAADVDLNGTIDNTVQDGTWKLILSSGSGGWDAYIVNRQRAGARFSIGDYSNRELISEPGTAENVITVGSINTNDLGDSRFPFAQESFFSSPGPTRDGRNKPNCYAPGAFIATARSSSSSYSSLPNFADYTYQAGTSMATPHMSGAIALLLQKMEESNIQPGYPNVKRTLESSKGPDRHLNVFELLSEPIVTGIEDKIVITDPSTDYRVIVPNNNYFFDADFIDNSPTGDFVNSYRWTVELHYSGFVDQVASYTVGSSGSVTISIPSSVLGDNNWTRDENGHIYGIVRVEGTDNDGITHEDEITIGVPYFPNRPVIYKQEVQSDRIALAWFGGGGAVSYDVAYRKDGGPSELTVVDVGANTSYTVTGLEPCSKYFIGVRGYNATDDFVGTLLTIETPVSERVTRTEKTNVPGGTTKTYPIEVRASESIQLKTGFHYRAINNSRFHAFITDECPPNIPLRVDSTRKVVTSDTSTISVVPKLEESINLFPNPVTSHVTIRTQLDSSYQLQIYRLDGRLLYHKLVQQKDYQIDLKSYHPGLYVVEIITATGSRYQEKILKR